MALSRAKRAATDTVAVCTNAGIGFVRVGRTQLSWQRFCSTSAPVYAATFHYRIAQYVYAITSDGELLTFNTVGGRYGSDACEGMDFCCFCRCCGVHVCIHVYNIYMRVCVCVCVCVCVVPNIYIVTICSCISDNFL
jgi:hypothetical protein